MESFRIKNLSFTYPGRAEKALDNIDITVNQGEFITVCGKSGCGKTTLLRLLKPAVAPFGNIQGDIFFEGKPLNEFDTGIQASKIGFVMQNPDNQIVTDKVWHELAFGLESLGFETAQIRARVAEMSSFFGIQNWFYKKTTDLSGGQKQLLNLASVMVMQPDVLILDEPTSQLDPIAAQEFLKTLEKINRELGTTVILSEHRLEDAIPISDRLIVLDNGKISANGAYGEVCEFLKQSNDIMFHAMPTPLRIYNATENGKLSPATAREGREWIEEYAKEHKPDFNVIPKQNLNLSSEIVVEAADVYFRYEKNLPDVVKGLNLKIHKGEFYSILGGNGTGKTTAVSLISGIISPQRGNILINGKEIRKIANLYDRNLSFLPQNPQTLFVRKTVYLDLMEMLSESKLTKDEKIKKIEKTASLCRIENLLDSHPYDLSGGEQQRAALAKVLLSEPHILILDEPTKGMDVGFKREFAAILKSLQNIGVTIIMVSHDIEFCAEYSDRCGLFFDGGIISESCAREFFSGKSFYTTVANRMSRGVIPEAVLADDVILALGGSLPKMPDVYENRKFSYDKVLSSDKKKKEKPSYPKIIMGIVLLLMFIITCIFQIKNSESINVAQTVIISVLSLSEITFALSLILPRKESEIEIIQLPKSDRKLTGRTLTAALLILIVIPATIFIGAYFLKDKKYYFISLLIILETTLPFIMLFEKRKPQPREMVVISVLCAIAVAGRSAFYMFPQFKPVIALVIISGICFGGETGFLVGAVTAFVSNFFFGQGPWTPWQMFGFGIIGFIAGFLFKKGLIRKTKASLCIFGFISVFIIYGLTMNSSTVILTHQQLNKTTITAACISGAPYDFIHALSTGFFLWFISEPMIEKLERIKLKYGLIER